MPRPQFIWVLWLLLVTCLYYAFLPFCLLFLYLQGRANLCTFPSQIKSAPLIHSLSLYPWSTSHLQITFAPLFSQPKFVPLVHNLYPLSATIYPWATAQLCTTSNLPSFKAKSPLNHYFYRSPLHLLPHFPLLILQCSLWSAVSLLLISRCLEPSQLF